MFDQQLCRAEPINDNSIKNINRSFCSSPAVAAGLHPFVKCVAAVIWVGWMVAQEKSVCTRLHFGLLHCSNGNRGYYVFYYSFFHTQTCMHGTWLVIITAIIFAAQLRGQRGINRRAIDFHTIRETQIKVISSLLKFIVDVCPKITLCWNLIKLIFMSENRLKHRISTRIMLVSGWST